MDGTLAILIFSQSAKKGNRRLLISFADVGLLQLELHGKPLPCTAGDKTLVSCSVLYGGEDPEGRQEFLRPEAWRLEWQPV